MIEVTSGSTAAFYRPSAPLRSRAGPRPPQVAASILRGDSWESLAGLEFARPSHPSGNPGGWLGWPRSCASPPMQGFRTLISTYCATRTLAFYSSGGPA